MPLKLSGWGGHIGRSTSILIVTAPSPQLKRDPSGGARPLPLSTTNCMLASGHPLLCLGMVVLSTAAHAQQPNLRDTSHAPVPTAEIFMAIAHADTAALQPLLGNDLRWVARTSGAVVGKPQLLATAAHALPLVSLQYEIDSLQTWQHGDIATAEYRVIDRRTFHGYQNVFVCRASDVFVRRHGRWELIRHTQAWIVHPPDTTAVDSAALVPFVGRYDRGAGFIDDVHFVDGHLVAQSTLEARLGEPGAHLLPVSADTFSPDGVAPMIVFERDAQGHVTGYVQQQPDGTITRARRLGIP